MQLALGCAGSFSLLTGPGVPYCVHQFYKRRKKQYSHCHGLSYAGILGNLLYWDSTLY